MKGKLLIATHNLGKFREYEIILKEILKLPLNLVSLEDLKIKEKVKEKGKNYKENAILKAKFYCKLSNIPTLADDSGLEIDILNGWPGIKSRRDEKGRELSDKELIKLVLEKLKGVPFRKRKAKYKAVVALAIPGKRKIFTFKGERKGFIAEKRSKKNWNGFPFDSIFYLPEKKKIFVDISRKVKATFSHRTKALIKALPLLKKLLVNN